MMGVLLCTGSAYVPPHLRQATANGQPDNHVASQFVGQNNFAVPLPHSNGGPPPQAYARGMSPTFSVLNH